MHPASAATICDLCGREIVADRAKHYRGHLENAQAYVDLLKRRGGDPSWSAKARNWIEHCEKVLAEPGSGTVN